MLQRGVKKLLYIPTAGRYLRGLIEPVLQKERRLG